MLGELKVRISEDWPDGALVHCISAHDSDSDANGRLQYSLEKGEGRAEVRSFCF